MTHAEAALIVARLVEAYPVPAWTDAAASLWVEMLIDLDRDTTAQVVRDLIATRSHRPAIADIRSGVASACADERVFLPADEAWGVVQKAIGQVGRYQPFPRTHPLVAHAVDLIGWQTICDSESIETTRAQFRNAYTSLLDRTRATAAASLGARSVPQIPTRDDKNVIAIESVRSLVAQIGGKR